MQVINEGKVKLKAPVGKISKELPVFYNPIMKLNRDVSIFLLNSINKKDLQIGLPLAGTGVRGIRFISELKKGKIRNISFNDNNEKAVGLIKENLKLNGANLKNVSVFNYDANKFLLESTGFDYIDVDPFGSPNFLLDSSIVRLARDGLLAVTATDTSALCGTYKSACLRKYWAVPSHDEIMHEVGIRILIRKVQLIGAQYEKALVPIYSYSVDHYMRVFFRCDKGKQKADNIIKQHGMLNSYGPLWLGKLLDEKVAKDISEQSDERLLQILKNEAKIDIVGFYNIPKLSRKYKLKMIKRDKLIEKIRKSGYPAQETHFAENSLKSNIPEEELVKLIRS